MFHNQLKIPCCTFKPYLIVIEARCGFLNSFLSNKQPWSWFHPFGSCSHWECTSQRLRLVILTAFRATIHLLWLHDRLSMFFMLYISLTIILLFMLWWICERRRCTYFLKLVPFSCVFLFLYVGSFFKLFSVNCNRFVKSFIYVHCHLHT